jgi:hypothetical protein
MTNMVKGLGKFKSAVLAITLGIFLGTTSYVTTSNAATVKNGVACKKADLKTKVGKKNYVCGNNPYVTPTKLTWMLTGCPEAYDVYIEAKDQYGIFKDIPLPPEGMTELENLQKSMDSLDTLMKTQVCKKGK